MLHRRTATTLAAGAALVLTGAAPAFASHEEPHVVQGNPDCEDAVAALDLAGFDSPDLESLLKDEDFGEGDLTTDIDAADFPGFDIFVIVKGGPHANVYLEPPFHDLGSPEGEAISHIEVCGVPTDDETPPPDDEEEPPPDEEEEPPPDEKDEAKDEEPTEDEKPEVPTEVPAGHEGSSGGISAGTIGLIAAATALLAGAAALVRRRFVNGS